MGMQSYRKSCNLVITQKWREILRFAQNDTTSGCHSERSEESLPRSRRPDL